MQELLSTGLDQAVVRIAAGRAETWGIGDEGAALFPAGQDAGDAFGSLQAAIERLHEVLFAHAFGRRSQDRDTPLVRDPAYPGFVHLGTQLEDSRFNAGHADDIVKEVDQVLWALQPLEIAIQDNAIPAGIDELDSRAQQL